MGSDEIVSIEFDCDCECECNLEEQRGTVLFDIIAS